MSTRQGCGGGGGGAHSLWSKLLHVRTHLNFKGGGDKHPMILLKVGAPSCGVKCWVLTERTLSNPRCLPAARLHAPGGLGGSPNKAMCCLITQVTGA